MKKIVIIMAAACAAGMLMGGSSNPTVAPPGTDNIAFGYGAGANSSGDNSDVICIGTEAGRYSSNNANTILIGKDVTASGKDGYIAIKAGNMGIDMDAAGKDINLIDWNGSSFLRCYEGGDGVRHVTSTGLLPVNTTDGCYEVEPIMSGSFEFRVGTTYLNSAGEIYLTMSDRSVEITPYHFAFAPNVQLLWPNEGSGDRTLATRNWVNGELSQPGLRFVDGQLCVYTNNVLAGTLTFTPAN